MPRPKKTERFGLYGPKKDGAHKTMLLCFNYDYEGGVSAFRLQDLLDFLKEKNVNPADVVLNTGFITRVFVKKE